MQSEFSPLSFKNAQVALSAARYDLMTGVAAEISGGFFSGQTRLTLLFKKHPEKITQGEFLRNLEVFTRGIKDMMAIYLILRNPELEEELMPRLSSLVEVESYAIKRARAQNENDPNILFGSYPYNGELMNQELLHRTGFDFDRNCQDLAAFNLTLATSIRGKIKGEAEKIIRKGPETLLHICGSRDKELLADCGYDTDLKTEILGIHDAIYRFQCDIDISSREHYPEFGEFIQTDVTDIIIKDLVSRIQHSPKVMHEAARAVG